MSNIILRMSWSSFEEQRLRELIEQGLSHREIGRILSRTAKAINSRSKLLQLGKDRSWTDEETAMLKEHYHSKSGVELKAMIRRPLSSIYQKARKLGMPRKWDPVPADTRDRVKAMHAEKMTDSEIAAELGIDRRYVNELRTLMGLPIHQDRLLEARRRGCKTQFERLGIKNRAELRYRKHRQYAHDHGLPEQLRFRAVQVA
jgi:hypothetical protein